MFIFSNEYRVTNFGAIKFGILKQLPYGSEIMTKFGSFEELNLI